MSRVLPRFGCVRASLIVVFGGATSLLSPTGVAPGIIVCLRGQVLGVCWIYSLQVAQIWPPCTSDVL